MATSSVRVWVTTEQKRAEFYTHVEVCDRELVIEIPKDVINELKIEEGDYLEIVLKVV